MPKRPKGKRSQRRPTVTRRPSQPPRIPQQITPATNTTVGQQFLKHVNTTKWYRSKTADRIPRKHRVIRPLAHLVFGTVKIAGYAVAGLGVGAVEGGRAVVPHVRRHVRKRVEHRKWTPHRHPVAGNRKFGDRLVRHAVACLCGEKFTNAEQLNEHHAKVHGDEARTTLAPERPTIHPGYTRRTAGQIKVRPTPGTPRGRHRTTRSTARHRRATTFVERHRAQITERGKAAMSSDSAVSAVSKAWAEVGDSIPRGLQDVVNLFAGLEQAASAKAEHVEGLQKTLATRLNLDPLVLHGLNAIIADAEAETAHWSMTIEVLNTVYAPLWALITQGIAIPTADALNH